VAAARRAAVRAPDRFEARTWPSSSACAPATPAARGRPARFARIDADRASRAVVWAGCEAALSATGWW
jgi:hypothetical protein